jgi:hypothetical protein
MLEIVAYRLAFAHLRSCGRAPIAVAHDPHDLFPGDGRCIERIFAPSIRQYGDGPRLRSIRGGELVLIAISVSLRQHPAWLVTSA